MSDATSPGGLIPNYRTPRLIGILNIVFACALLLCGLGSAVYVAVLPALAKGMGQFTKQAEDNLKAQRKQQVDALIDQEKQAETDEQKAEIAERRKMLEAAPTPKLATMPDLNNMGFNDPKMVAWWGSETVSGLVLNVMMLVSGVGLASYKAWGRALAVWTAALKIARLWLAYSIFTVAIAPPLAQRVGTAVGKMMADQQQAMGRPGQGMPPADFFIKTYTIMWTATGVGMMTLGVIYPALVLWFLTRPPVKLAFAGASKPKTEPNEPW